MTLESFATDLLEEVLQSVEAADNGDFQENRFTEEILSWLTELGECFTPEVAHFKQPGMKLNAWDLQEEGTLDLFVTVFDGTRALYRLPRGEVLDAISRCQRFLERSMNGLFRDLEETDPGFEPAQSISARSSQISRARVFLLTNGIVASEVMPDSSVGGVIVSHHIWDLERLFQVSEGRTGPETIDIDSDQLSGGLHCVALPSENEVYQSYVGVAPGPVLAGLFSRWGQRLLERNLRSYLQTRTKVNKEMMETLRKTPGMFFAYNNGISTTADEVDIAAGQDGSATIRRLRNFQVVNGGQTTATLTEAAKSGMDLSNVFVQFKLTVLKDPTKVDEAVPLIARYANSQNKVSLSDFSSNHPYHVELERVSRMLWVPNPDQRGKSTTKWYYERVRAAYLNDVRARGTPSKKRQFRNEFPVQQKITKTELAKYDMSWRQLPHIVSLGAEKNYLRFMDLLVSDKWPLPDELTFQKMVAMAILFRRCDTIVRKGEYQGYKANIDTYSIAYLSNLTGAKVDLLAIWNQQALPAVLEEALQKIVAMVYTHITTPPREGMNVTEWCKKQDCWTTLCAKTVSDLPDLSPILWKGPSQTESNTSSTTVEAPAPGKEAEMICEFPPLSKESWFGLAAWGKQTGMLNGWERKFAFSMGRLVARRLNPYPNQVKYAVKIVTKASEKGWKAEHVKESREEEPKKAGGK